MPPMPSQSLYELLEVAQGASVQEIEGAYKRLQGMVAADSLAVYAMLDEAEVQALRDQVEQAYFTLHDPARRAAYDADRLRQLAAAEPGPTPLRPVPLPAELPPSSDGVQDVAAGRSRMPADSWPAFRQAATPSASAAPAAVRAGQPAGSGAGRLGSPAAVRGPSARSGQGAAGPSTRVARASAPLGHRRLLRPALAVELSEATEVDGALLRRLRESAQASLEDVSEITKISKRYLCAVEADDRANLPANVYVRGFVSEYARVLGLDPRQVAASYMAHYLRQRARSGE